MKYNITRGFEDACFYMDSIKELESNLRSTFSATSVLNFDWQTTNFTHLDEAKLLKHIPVQFEQDFVNSCDNIWKLILNQNQTENRKVLTRLLNNPTITPFSILMQTIQKKMAINYLNQLKSTPVFNINQQVTCKYIAIHFCVPRL